ncbi:inverse autotransporter beta domain-containing protein [Xenorhabdus bovienii]|uniref:inverse autotransporter beta domain-containing protein n=1 Tax=Xenorhabdus bovienii TaxID=40576 RepID=UPI001EDE4D40|nr:inverse autotransporter beta domain-containing protein [Xenorhabdus bovienii]MCG3461260.1 inverse autotransporter beta domain-containing protein [Xenorhabdus bovienii]
MSIGETIPDLYLLQALYGTAKIQANIDDCGRLDGSQFDMLLTLYDEKANLLFTQFGLPLKAITRLQLMTL